MPATYTLVPLTASAVAPSSPVPPARYAHTNWLLAGLNSATNTSELPRLVSVVPPSTTVFAKTPAKYMLPVASTAVAVTYEYSQVAAAVAVATARADCQAGACAAADRRKVRRKMANKLRTSTTGIGKEK